MLYSTLLIDWKRPSHSLTAARRHKRRWRGLTRGEAEGRSTMQLISLCFFICLSRFKSKQLPYRLIICFCKLRFWVGRKIRVPRQHSRFPNNTLVAQLKTAAGAVCQEGIGATHLILLKYRLDPNGVGAILPIWRQHRRNTVYCLALLYHWSHKRSVE